MTCSATTTTATTTGRPSSTRSPQPAFGTVINNGDATITFTPGPDFDSLGCRRKQTVTFTYTATDRHGAVSNEATVTVIVTGDNDAPVASDVVAAARKMATRSSEATW